MEQTLIKPRVNETTSDEIKIIEECKVAIKSNPNNLGLYTKWREAIGNLPNPDLYLDEYRQIMESVNTSHSYKEYGNLLSELKRYPAATEQYEKALKLDPNNVKAYSNWGRVLQEQKKYDEAIEKYDKAIKIDPNYANVYNNYGTLLYDLEKYKEALEQYQKAINLNPNLFYVYRNWGLALEKLQSFDIAIEKYKKAINLNPDLFEAYYDLGWLYIKKNSNSEALDIFNKALKNDSFDKYELHFGKGYALENSGRFREAMEEYEKSFSCKKFPYSIHNMAALLEKQGLYKIAREKWNEAIKIYDIHKEEERKKENSNYFLYYGSIYQFSTLRDLNKAEDIYLQGLKLDNDNTQILLNLIQLCQAKRNEINVTDDNAFSKTQEYCNVMSYFRQAERILNKRLELVRSADTLAEYGNFYKEVGFVDKAEEKYTEALNINETHFNALTNLGAIEMNRENYQKAISLFKQATRSDPDNFDIQSNLAEAYLKAEKIEDAERLYSEIIDKAPYHMDSLIGLSQTYIKMGENAMKEKDSEKAEDMFSKAEEIYIKIDHLMNYTENASKILNQNEKSSVYYLMGYNEVMVYEIQKKFSINRLNSSSDRNRLISAKDNFKLVKKGATNYYKAQRAIAKIDETLNPSRGTIDKWAPRLIFMFSFIGLLFIQIVYFLGRPEFGFSGYSIDRGKLEKLVIPNDDKLKQSVVKKLNNLAEQNYVFVTTEDFYDRIKDEFNPEVVTLLRQTPILQNSGPKIKAFHSMETGYYVLSTFGCLLFMIAGLYLNQISKLKVGNLELEKSTIDQISTPTSLGITK